VDPKGQAPDNYIDDYDFNTGENVNWQKVVEHYSGQPMSDALCDGYIYRKHKDGDYLRRGADTWTARQLGVKVGKFVDSTASLQRAIDSFDTDDETFTGVNILLGPGIYNLDNLIVKSGVRLYALQNPKDNHKSKAQTLIRPYSNPDRIIEVAAGASNWSIENLYIDGDYENQPQMICGVELRGEKCLFQSNNVTRTAGPAVITSAGLIDINYNSILGFYGDMPDFESETDFRGALWIKAMGDSYVFKNEISASYPYFGSTAPLRDSLRRIAAVACTGFVGTSVISSNLFENAERAFILGQSLYLRSCFNRFELSGGGGLYLYGGTQFFTSVGDNWSDNSLAEDGTYDDIEIAPGAAGNISFIGPTFESLINENIPTSGNKVGWNITNKGSISVNLVSPNVDPIYAEKGLINNEDPQALPVKQAMLQYDIDNPHFSSVSTGKLPGISPQVGYVKLRQGTSSDNGSFVGAVEFYKPDDTLAFTIGFSPEQYLSFLGELFAFAGNISLIKNGTAKVTVWSFDGSGDAEILMQLTKPSETEGEDPSICQFNFKIDKDTGNSKLIATGDIEVGASENWTFLANGYSKLNTPPPTSGYDYNHLVYNRTTNLLEYAPPSNNKKIVSSVVDMNEINNTYMNSSYSDVPFGVTVVFENVTDSGTATQNIGEAYKIGNDGTADKWVIGFSKYKLS